MNAERIIAGIVLLVVLLAAGISHARAESGWTHEMTFTKNGHRVVLVKRTDPERENFVYYGVKNEGDIPMCVVPRVWANRHTRTGLQMISLVGTTGFHELGFVTYKTGHEPQSAEWTITLFLLENECSLSDPFPTRIQSGPSPRRPGYRRTP